MTANNELTRDVAHIHHAELLTPVPQQSLDFFTDLFGMQIESRSGQSGGESGGAPAPGGRHRGPRTR